MKKNCKWMALMMGVLLAGMALAGCMNTGARVTPETGPEASNMPQLSDIVDPGAEASSAPAGFDWKMQGSEVEEKLGLLSEIQSGRVIVTGATALVGVTFANQYKGEMTQRIHDMVAGTVQEADSTIQTVAVTAEQEDVKRINELADQIASGTPVSQLEAEIGAIVRNVTTIQ